jgi:hypothetical protein
MFASASITGIRDLSSTHVPDVGPFYGKWIAIKYIYEKF